MNLVNYTNKNTNYRINTNIIFMFDIREVTRYFAIIFDKSTNKCICISVYQYSY